MKGPRPLAALLRSWKPTAAAAQARLSRDDALAQLAIAWAGAVGAGVAARNRPLKFYNGVLTVLTASSAWSDELSLLAPHIVQALQRRCPQAKLTELRFRVASGRSQLLFERAPGMMAERPIAVSGHAISRRDNGTRFESTAQRALKEESVNDILTRLQTLQQALNAERDRAGWTTCARCGRRFYDARPQTAVCAPCAQAQRHAAEATIERTLMQAPWLKNADVVQALPHARRPIIERVRQRLLARWQTDLDAAQRRLRRGTTTPQDRVLAWSYVMLLSHLPQHELGAAVVTDVLGRDWASTLFDAQRTPKREAARPLRPNHTQ